MDCPKCLGKLQKKEINVKEVHEFKELKGAGVSYILEVDQCFVCGGVWFDKGELDKYTTEKLTIIDSATLGKQMDRKLDEKEGKCPRCKIMLKKGPYKKEPGITLDVCEKCGGVWLDSTEIDRVERANKEKVGFLQLLIRGFKKPKQE